MSQLANYELSDGVARITMDDGKVNAMSLAMLETLHGAFDRAAREEAQIVVLRSARPGIFSAGFDLKVFASGDAAASVAMVRAGAELALKLLSFGAPVVSVCAGHAFPMGAFLILASDVRIAADAPYRIGFNEVAIGIAVPTFALEIGRQRLTPATLSRTAATGEMFALRDAAPLGFFDHLVAEHEMDAAVARAVAGLKQIHLPSHALTKRRLRAGAIAAVRAAIDAELTVEAFVGRAQAAAPHTPRAA